MADPNDAVVIPAVKSLNESFVKRWGVLLLVSLAMSANYYFYDVLSPIQDLLQEKLGLTATQYGSFFSIYSFPNTFFLMAAIGGMICDRMGIRITGTMFFGSMVVGAALTYYGTTETFNAGGPGYALFSSFLTDYSPAFKMMAIGFFFFGLGAETACVVISKAIVKWFKGKELALAMGVNLSVARVASSTAFSVGAFLSRSEWNLPVAFGALLVAIGLLAFLAYAFFDVAFDRRAKLTKGLEPEEPFKIMDAVRLLAKPSYLFVALLCVTFYSAVFPFNKFAVDLLENKFLLEKQSAALMVSYLPLAQAAITPLFGWVCDVKGKSATLMILGSLLLIIGHGLLSLTSLSPWVGLVCLGLAFSLVPAAMWPALAKIVPNSQLGTAYGLTFTIQNFGLMATTPLIGYVLEASNPGVTAAKAAGQAVVYNYTNPILMLAGFGLLGIVFAFLLRRADKTSGYGLELPNKAKKPA